MSLFIDNEVLSFIIEGDSLLRLPKLSQFFEKYEKRRIFFWLYYSRTGLFAEDLEFCRAPDYEFRARVQLAVVVVVVGFHSLYNYS